MMSGYNNLALVFPGAPGDYCKDKSKKKTHWLVLFYSHLNYLLKNTPIFDFNVKS